MPNTPVLAQVYNKGSIDWRMERLEEEIISVAGAYAASYMNDKFLQ